MKVAVLGATGCGGQAVVSALLARGDEVLAISRGQAGAPPAAASWARCDRRDRQDLQQVLGAFRPTAVVDQVAYTPDDVSGLLAALPRGVTRLVWASSAVVYGDDAGGAPFGEDAPLRPSNPFSKNKAEAEALARWRPGTTALRLGYLYGPGHAPLTPFGRDPFLLERLRRGEPIPLPQLDPPRLQPVYSADYAAVVVAVLAHPAPPPILNVAGDETFTWAQAMGAWAAAARAHPPTVLRESAEGLAALAPAAVRAFLPALVAPTRMNGAALRAFLPGWRPRAFARGVGQVLAEGG